MKNTMMSVGKMVWRNWPALFWFEFPYKFAGIALSRLVLPDVLERIRRAANLPFISQENLGTILRSLAPATLLALLILAALGYVYLEMTAMVILCEAGYRGERISAAGLWRRTFLSMFPFFHYKNIWFFLALFPFLTVSAFRLTVTVLSGFAVPDFLMSYYYEMPKVRVAVWAGMALAHIPPFLCLFVMPHMILKKERAAASLRESLRMLKTRFWGTLFTLIGAVLMFGGLFLAVGLAAVLWLSFYTKARYGAAGAEEFRQMCAIYGQTGGLLLEIFFPAFYAAVILALYHGCRGEAPAPSFAVPVRPWVRPLRIFVPLAAIFFTVSFFSETEIGGGREPRSVLPVELVAHRAGAAQGPENTVAALEKAVESGADMAEIDVQQTRDQVLIVMHDSNFQRTAGKNRAVWDTDYEEASAFDAGTCFSPEFAGERIPTLDQMLTAAKGRIRLMIELKSTGREKNLVEDTLKLIRGHGMESQCIVASMDIGLLQRTKKLDPEMETVYITAVLLPGDTAPEGVDGYSVEGTSISISSVWKAHVQGRRVYGWTANSKQAVYKLLKCQADGIVTDNPSLARIWLENTGENSFADWLTEIVYPTKRNV